MRPFLRGLRCNQSGSVLTTVVVLACMLGLAGLLGTLLVTTVHMDHHVIRSIQGVTIGE